jgi:predicted nucleic acid-binding protein
MQPYSLNSFELVMAPSMVMVDTNVLVSAFIASNEGQHDTAIAFLTLLGEVGLALVPIPVLIEAWGMIVGSRKNVPAGLELLRWATDRQVVQLIPGDATHAPEVAAIAKQYRVDMVDAWILYLVTDMHTRCNLNERVRIATFDTTDFLPCAGRFPMRIYDIEADEDLDY